MTVVVGFMWADIGNLKSEHRQDRLEIRKECADAIDEIRQDLKTCQNENDTLRRENVKLHRRVSALEVKLKR